MTAAALDRYSLRQHRRDPCQTASDTATNTVGTHGRPLSARTMRRRLTGGLQCRPFTSTALSDSPASREPSAVGAEPYQLASSGLAKDPLHRLKQAL